MTAKAIVQKIIENDDFLSPDEIKGLTVGDAEWKDQLRTSERAFLDNKARSKIRALAKNHARASNVASVRIIPGNSEPVIVSGKRGGHFTKGGRPIDHPGAYGNIGWSNMVYRTNNEVVTVGLEWLHQQLPKETARYIAIKGQYDSSSVGKKEYDELIHKQQNQRDKVYSRDEPELPESSQAQSKASVLLEDVDDTHRFAATVVLRSPEDPETLLVRREGPPEEGKWASPGGHMNTGEQAKEAARRELQEETGVEPDDLHFLKTVPVPGQAALTQIYWCVVPPETTAKAGDDAEKIKWLKCSNLPELAFDNNQTIADALQAAFHTQTEAASLVQSHLIL